MLPINKWRCIIINICFTGHRPNKLFGYNLNNEKYYDLGAEILTKIIEIINNSEEKSFTFYFGGAIGVDQLAFDWVKHFKDNKDIRNEYLNKKIVMKLVLCIPFEKQSSKWKSEDVERWRKQFFSADDVVFTDETEGYKLKEIKIGDYHPAKMQKRNEYMVNNSDIVIAIWDGEEKGGTYNCIKYAKKLGKEIIYINPNEL